MIEHELDCPICLDAFRPGDLQHPLRCARKCGYNFCISCIESLIQSAKDDYMEASDGNKHVKVFLHCPNCRSDLSSSIRDTLLLRKVHTLAIHSDSNVELSDSELRLKQVLYDEEIQCAIAEAQMREDSFFGRQLEQYDEIGVEIGGVDADSPLSFVLHKKSKDYMDRTVIDTTLFQGLECAMTKEEQLVVTELMTSGDTSKLARAAEILHDIETRVQKGLPPPTAASSGDRRNRLSSIYELIEESKRAKEKKAKYMTDKKKSPHPSFPMGTKYAKHKAVEKEIGERMHFLKLHPLPVRMPKFAEFHLHDETTSLPFFSMLRSADTCPMTFLDDVWDGSVVDAFSKITISSSGENLSVKKKVVENIGVNNILSGIGEDIRNRIETERRRVLVASTSNQAGRQGVLKGDVVTHFNGEEFDGTAQELVEAIHKCDGTFTLVLNAERSIAEALKRRAMV